MTGTPKQKAARKHNWLLYRVASARNSLAQIAHADTVGPVAKETLRRIDLDMANLQREMRYERIDPTN